MKLALVRIIYRHKLKEYSVYIRNQNKNKNDSSQHLLNVTIVPITNNLCFEYGCPIWDALKI